MGSVIDLSDGMASVTDPSSSKRSSYAQDNDDASHSGGDFSKILGTDWSDSNITNLAVNSDKVYYNRLLSTAPLRELEFVKGFFDSRPSIQLSKKHLYGVLLYTRGNHEHETPCSRCRTPGKRIFTKCVSLSGMAQGACAADIWSGTPMNCDHHNTNVSKANHDIDSENDVVITKSRRLSSRGSTAHHIKKQSTDTLPRAMQQDHVNPSQPFLRFDDDDEEEGSGLETSSTENDLVINVASKHLAIDMNDIPRKSSSKKISKRLVPKAYSSIVVNGKQFSTPSSHNSTRIGHLGKRRRGLETDNVDGQPPSSRSRHDPPIRDTLDYLQGDFDYGATELLLEVTPDMIAEASAKNRIQVGPYLLSRFSVEMNVMWAVRVAAARWAQGLN